MHAGFQWLPQKIWIPPGRRCAHVRRIGHRCKCQIFEPHGARRYDDDGNVGDGIDFGEDSKNEDPSVGRKEATKYCEVEDSSGHPTLQRMITVEMTWRR